MPIAVAALQTPWGQAVDGEAPLQCPLPHPVQTHQPGHLCHSFITILEVNPLPPLPCSNFSPIHTSVHSHTKMAGLQFTCDPTMAFGGVHREECQCRCHESVSWHEPWILRGCNPADLRPWIVFRNITCGVEAAVHSHFLAVTENGGSICFTTSSFPSATVPTSTTPTQLLARSPTFSFQMPYQKFQASMFATRSTERWGKTRGNGGKGDGGNVREMIFASTCCYCLLLLLLLLLSLLLLVLGK